MNLILLHDDDFRSDDAVRLEGRRARHIRKVLRAQPGEEIRVGRLGGDTGMGRIVSLDAGRVELRVRLTAPPPPPALHKLALALPRPPALRRILRAAACFGIKEIALIGSARVERSFWQSTQLDAAKIQEQLELGLEQARDTILPVVWLEPRFSRFLSGRLPSWLQEARGVVGHPGAETPCPVDLGHPAVVVVGPEGGFQAGELERLEEIGVERVSLGNRPLTVDTAVVALLARLG